MEIFVQTCKEIAVNIFWVLAALFQITAVLVLIFGAISGLIHSKNDNEE